MEYGVSLEKNQVKIVKRIIIPGLSPTLATAGVQFGMTALNERTEAHRILCVITDGQPNNPHGRVITGQLRRAAQAGIHVIGIGIGREASYVKSLFPDHVHVNRVNDLPSKLIAKLNEVCEFGGRNRGRRIRGLDKRMVKKVS